MDFAVLVEKGAETVVTVGVTLVAALFIALAQFSRINGASLKSVQSYVLFRRVIRWPALLFSLGLYISALLLVKVCPAAGLSLFLAGTYGFVSVGASMFKWISSEPSEMVFDSNSYAASVTSDYLLKMSLRSKIGCVPLVFDYLDGLPVAHRDRPSNGDVRFVAKFAISILSGLCSESDDLEASEVHAGWWWVIRLADKSQVRVEQWLDPEVMNLCSKSIHGDHVHCALSKHYSRELILCLLTLASDRRRTKRETNSLSRLFEVSEDPHLVEFCGKVIESPIVDLGPFDEAPASGRDLDKMLEDQCVVTARIWGEAVKLLGNCGASFKPEVPALISSKESHVLSPVLRYFLSSLLLDTVSRSDDERHALACALSAAFGDLDYDRLFQHAFLEKVAQKNFNPRGIVEKGVSHSTIHPAIVSNVDPAMPDFWDRFLGESSARTELLSKSLFYRLHDQRCLKDVVGCLGAYVAELRRDYYVGIEHDWRFYERALAEAKSILDSHA